MVRIKVALISFIFGVFCFILNQIINDVEGNYTNAFLLFGAILGIFIAGVMIGEYK